MFEIGSQSGKSESLYDQWAEIFTVEHVCSPLHPSQICSEDEDFGNLSGNFPIVVTRTYENGRVEAIGEIDEDLVRDCEYSSEKFVDFLSKSVKVAMVPLPTERCVSANTPFMEAMRQLINRDLPYYLVLRKNRIVGVFSQENFYNANFQMMLLRFLMEIEGLAGYILRRSPRVAFDYLSIGQRKKVDEEMKNRSKKWEEKKEKHRKSQENFFVSGLRDDSKYYYPKRVLNDKNTSNIGIYLNNIQVLNSSNLPCSRQEIDLEKTHYFNFTSKIRSIRRCEYICHLIPRFKFDENENVEMMIDLRNTLAHGETYKLLDLKPNEISDFLFWLTNLRDEMSDFLRAGYVWDGTKLKAIDAKFGKELTDFSWPFELPERFS